jgi:hypothetical protein
MNRRQKLFFLLCVLVMGVMIIYPPFVVPGEMMDGVYYAPIWQPPPPIEPNSDYWSVVLFFKLLFIQLAFAGFITVIGLILLRTPWTVSDSSA